jgi:hypothetical protein
MATTTTNYGWTVPQSSDLVTNGSTAIATLGDDIDAYIAGSSASGKLFFIAAQTRETSSRTTTSATWVNTGTPHSVTFTTGKSGVFALVFRASMSNSTASARNEAGVNITGGVSESPTIFESVQTTGSTRVSGTHVMFFDATPNTSTTITLQFQTTTGTLTIHDTELKVMCLG